MFLPSKRFTLFHNGFISNFKELLPSHSELTDSEVIAYLIDEKLEQGLELNDAIKIVCESRLYGTWRLAILGPS